MRHAHSDEAATIENGVDDGRVADVGVPFVHWELAGNDGGSTSLIVDDRQQVARLM
jgi:hypothetical protein